MGLILIQCSRCALPRHDVAWLPVPPGAYLLVHQSPDWAIPLGVNPNPVVGSIPPAGTKLIHSYAV